MSKKVCSSIYDFASILLNAILVVSLVFTFFFKVSVVQGSSMEHTLSNGDRLLTLAKDWDVAYGDIVVISQPNDYHEVLIKRVIATEGQTIYIHPTMGHVVVDGKILDEPYIAERTSVLGDTTFPLTVPKGKVFVMGDNRNHSGDSRFSAVGLIDERYILGEAVYRIGDTHLLNSALEK